MRPSSYSEDELIDAYIIAIGVTGDDSSSWASEELTELVWQEPERAWSLILSIAQRELPKWQLAVLAAGPLEDLLRVHGPNFIDRIEQESSTNEPFRRDVLARVYPHACWPVEVADRIRTSVGSVSRDPATKQMPNKAEMTTPRKPSD